MKASRSGEAEPPGRLGRMEGALTRLFTKSATVRASRLLEERFHRVTLDGESLRGVRWTPGDKLQVALGGWAYRTYTPMSWDAETGSTQLLVYLHGEAPGAAWGRAVKVGDPCALFGPRASIDLDALERPALVFGDETSFALSHAARFTGSGSAEVRMVFEVASRRVSESVLGQLDIASADVIERAPDDSHLSEIEEVARGHLRAHPDLRCVLSGKATSIQRLSKRLRSLGVSSRQIRTRAYWAPGKVGLD